MTSWTLAAAPPSNAVATQHPIATQAGLEILAKGGNAFDAAIAVSAVLGVVAPYNSGLGGGGFWLLHSAKSNNDVVVDAREIAPNRATAAFYLKADGRVDNHKLTQGVTSAAIPGEAAAWDYIAKHYGKLTLEECLTPAIHYAGAGFNITQAYLNALFSYGSTPLRGLRETQASDIYLINNKPPAIGQILKQPQLAKTLKAIAKQGRDGFYQGKIAEQLVADVQAAGGLWTLADLADYEIKIREPIHTQFGKFDVLTVPPPSAGGVALLTMLNILAPYDFQKLSSTERTQKTIEAMRLAYWDRARHLGDPDFVKVPTNALIAPAHATYLRSLIKPNQPTPSRTLGQVSEIKAMGPHTAHFSILDTYGNQVSVTVSMNHMFGSRFVSQQTGVLLNNHMDDFTALPGTTNQYDIIGTEHNKIEAHKRPLSSMAPVIVRSHDKIALLGTPGGSRIPTVNLLGILALSAGLEPEDWVKQGRFHHQYLPDRVEYEPFGLSAFVQEKLVNMGYVLKQTSYKYGNMQAILWDKKNNTVKAASDPRQSGLAKTST